MNSLTEVVARHFINNIDREGNQCLTSSGARIPLEYDRLRVKTLAQDIGELVDKFCLKAFTGGDPSDPYRWRYTT